ncbi:FecR domain-containing protein [Pectobacterium cacticida]|uniref:FecR domain-containing protein n=1 Tax=Pectobacterium cacticida TaxID=69221 RepID=A0ABZ2GB40_9GAMM|nr:FecR domain-containing protein [Pectobacterium cacticida]UYX06772.1 FecR domain-containing protein [Pectobacterium cacticida]
MNERTFYRDRQGQSIQPDSAREAVAWLTQLMSDNVTEQDRREWLCWRESSTDNEQAWQHIESVCANLGKLNARAAHQSLSTLNDNIPRRSVLKALAVLCVVGGAGVAGARTDLWQSLTADYHTQVGEQRQVALNDGTLLLLNTQTALNVAYGDDLRQLALIRGEVLIETGQAEKATKHPRPFMVITPQGKVEALGTRFSLRVEDDHTQVAVYDGAVRLYPQLADKDDRVVKRGQTALFTAQRCGQVATVQAEPAWVKGQLLADNQRLADFVNELSRYRHGVIHCQSEVANLRFSGVFPLSDTDNILAALVEALPVQVRYFSRYWVQIAAR